MGRVFHVDLNTFHISHRAQDAHDLIYVLNELNLGSEEHACATVCYNNKVTQLKLIASCFQCQPSRSRNRFELAGIERQADFVSQTHALFPC